MDNAYRFLKEQIKYGDSVIVAVSGGPDSMALLHLLIKLKEKLDIEVICAHVNHNLRKESFNEKIMVENYCNEHDVKFESMLINNYGDDNFHNEARTKRYDYFHEIVKKYKAKFLLTAHHGDDLIETILMRIVRGSTLKGYSGFSKIVKRDNYLILRPLIEMTKEELEKYDVDNNIPYATDMSNFKDVYTRNRFRKYIIPELKKEEPNLNKKFYKFSKTLLEYNEYIDKQVNNIIDEIYQQNILDLDKFNKLEYVIAMKVIYYILEQIYQDDLMLITDSHAEIIYNLAISSKANAMVYLPNNLKVIKYYNNITFKIDNLEEQDYEIEMINYLTLPNGHIIEVVSDNSSDNNFICRLNKDDVLFPLYVRNRKDGDRMCIKGMNGSKKIKDIFINEKISVDQRKMWPIVEDSQGTIVWLPGLKKSKFDKTKNEKYDIILKYH